MTSAILWAMRRHWPSGASKRSPRICSPANTSQGRNSTAISAARRRPGRCRLTRAWALIWRQSAKRGAAAAARATGCRRAGRSRRTGRSFARSSVDHLRDLRARAIGRPAELPANGLTAIGTGWTTPLVMSTRSCAIAAGPASTAADSAAAPPSSSAVGARPSSGHPRGIEVEDDVAPYLIGLRGKLEREQARTARTALSAKARNTGSLAHPGGIGGCDGLNPAVRTHDDVQLGPQARRCPGPPPGCSSRA